MRQQSLISKFFWSPFSGKAKIEHYQKVIRDAEWSVIRTYIPENSSLLDVGCGAGDNLSRAKSELKCTVAGIDPAPGAHGVGRFLGGVDVVSLNIIQGFAEQLPYSDKTFDVVFSSHVLEHVNDERKSLREMKRVLKDDGVLIIGMPTALMTALSYLSQILFTTHAKLLFAIKSIGKEDFFTRVRQIFIPDSHSKPRATTIFYDLFHYRVRNWQKIVETEFKVEKKLEPFLYPYPDYFQFFKIHNSFLGGSSVFFICRKK